MEARDRWKCRGRWRPRGRWQSRADGSADVPPLVDGAADAPPLAQGERCETGARCATGYCAGGYCCNTACVQGCFTCSAPGAEGTCSPVVAGQDPATTASRTLRPPVDGMASVMVPANAADIPSERSVRREGARTPSSTRRAPAMPGVPASRAAAAAAAVRHVWAAPAPPGAAAGRRLSDRGFSATTRPVRLSAASARAAMRRANVARAIAWRGSAAERLPAKLP